MDHFGGAAELAALMPIVHVWDNGLPDADPDGNKTSTWPLTSKAYRTMPVKERHVVKPGVTLPLKASGRPLELRCLIARQERWEPKSTIRLRIFYEQPGISPTCRIGSVCARSWPKHSESTACRRPQCET